MPDQIRRAVVVCVGNELIADDAAGYEVYRLLEAMAPRPGVRLVYASTCGIDLVELLDGEDLLVVVDAVCLGQEVGTVQTFPFANLMQPAGQISAHGIGFAEAIQIGQILYPERIPPKIYLVGVEGRCFTHTREHMSPDVDRAIPEAAAVVQRLVAGEF